MNTEFSCACTLKCWRVIQIAALGGAIECTECNTRLVFTIDTIEYSV
jgi:DNA-directed RNA polymerase subunit RPC12/RpoP